MLRFWSWVGLAMLIGFAGLGLASGSRDGPRPSAVVMPTEVSFKDATFELSSDPDQVILGWGYGSGMSNRSLSMKLYGDGRLELKSVGSEEGNESYTRELIFSEMVSLVRVAVDHGLAEWDGARVWAEVAAAGGGLARRMADAGGMGVEIHLDEYRRGNYARSPLKRSFAVNNAQGSLREAPGVLELQGLHALSEFANNQMKIAREAGNNG